MALLIDGGRIPPRWAEKERPAARRAERPLRTRGRLRQARFH